ncbi:NTPase KAP family P-loop domain-containing protein 1 [Tachyglossus aculeatus]|uniref:NTPase KAP family P-loop domain-containing protein 1 n=1 Tax=Tachyglossus aculeatus TaxID=9261 RepID=UPI0018F492EF|nr:NTPase KAP family P-loop domain-containing protein 1 [Tachyglossus aculeatus]
MLDKITALMQQEAAKREAEELQRVQRKPREAWGWAFPSLLWHLVFYQPVVTEMHLRCKIVRFVFIRFSAWQYAGSDKLWAGLVTTLCEGIRSHYGALPLSFYTVLGQRPVFAKGFRQREWLCRRKVGLVLLGLLAVLVVGIALLYLSLCQPAQGIRASGGLLKVLGGTATTLSGSGLLMTVLSLGKNLLVSQKQKIERLLSRERFGSHLGFMCEVKKEVELLTNFVAFMEIFQRHKLRIVLEITSLDTCCPERVVGVLNAINTLLSDCHAPFIFILVVDPSILVTCLESSGTMRGTADNGYLFLNRIVTLPFSVPVMGRRAKLRFLQDAVQSRDDLHYRRIARGLRRALGRGADPGESAKLLRVEVGATEADRAQLDAEAARCIQEAFFALHNEHDCLCEFVPDNIISMQRIVNTVPITIRLLLLQQRGGAAHLALSPRQATAWVVLANQWPCRLSWLLQCLEDRRQAEGPAAGGPGRLWDVFRETCGELAAMTKAIQNVLALDGDPELFERFLDLDFPFTVPEAERLLRCTVNLDHSIRAKLGQLRGVKALRAPAPNGRKREHSRPDRAEWERYSALEGLGVGAARVQPVNSQPPPKWYPAFSVCRGRRPPPPLPPHPGLRSGASTPGPGPTVVFGCGLTVP